jgi:hypothetical protein
MMLSQIEHVRRMTIDDAAAPPVKVYAVAQMRTRMVDRTRGTAAPAWSSGCAA